MEALNADNKTLFSEYRCMLFKSLELAERASDAELCVLLSKEDGISNKIFGQICRSLQIVLRECL